VFVAVPPWETENLRVFGRDGTQKEFSILDVEPPEESGIV
jgi:hypothetical protein